MKSIIKNFFYSSLTTFLSILIPLLTYPYLARVLGPENLGRMGVVSSFANYFVVAAGLGFATYGVRTVAASRKDRASLDRTVTELLLIAAAAAIAAAAVYCVCILVVPRYRSDARLFALFGITILSAAGALDWVFRGIEEFKFIGLRNAVLQVLYVSAVFWFIRKSSDILVYAVILAGFSVLGAAVNLGTARGYVSPVLRGIRPARHLPPMAIFAIIAFSITAYTNLDFLFLGLFSTDREAGLYSVSLRLARVVTTVTATLSGVLLPRLSLLAFQDEGEYRRLLNSAFTAILLFALPAAVGMVVVADDLALFFGGSAYLESSKSLRILAGLVPIVAMSNFLQMQILIPKRREILFLISMGFGFAVTAAGMALLVAPYGHRGAALGMVLGEGAVLCVQGWICREELRHTFDGQKIASYVAGAAFCGAFAYIPSLVLRSGIPRLGVSVLSGSFAYLVFLILVKEPFSLGLLKRILRTGEA